MNKRGKTATYVLFYGSLWGITEATLGHLLHTLPVLISGSVMFPIALYFMARAYHRSESKKVIILMGVTAALIKSVDVLIPGLPLIKTFNPMAAIIYQAISITAFLILMNSKKPVIILSGAVFTALSWRIIFVLSSLLIDNRTTATVGWVNNPDKVFSFIIVNGLISSIIAAVVIFVERRIKFSLDRSYIFKPAYALGLFLSAGLLQYFF